MDQGWPQVNQAYDGTLRRMYDYLKLVKSNVRQAQQKAATGGKKAKGGKTAQKGEEKPIENVALFVALEYPDW